MPKQIENAGWERVGSDTFSTGSRWSHGVYDDKPSRVELGIVDGKYRFNVELNEGWRRFQKAPYRDVVNLYAAVDFKLVSSTAAKPAFGLLFSKVGNAEYKFCLKVFPNGNWFRLERFDGAALRLLIDWTSTPVKLDELNRMGVLVENQHIQLFINSELVGEQREPTFTGGKVGLSVEAESAGSVVVDFDNFELRAPPK